MLAAIFPTDAIDVYVPGTVAAVVQDAPSVGLGAGETVGDGVGAGVVKTTVLPGGGGAGTAGVDVPPPQLASAALTIAAAMHRAVVPVMELRTMR